MVRQAQDGQGGAGCTPCPHSPVSVHGHLRDAVSGPARELRETNGLLREELEGLRRRLGHQEEMQESLAILELEKEVRLGVAGGSLWAVHCVGDPGGFSLMCRSPA